VKTRAQRQEEFKRLDSWLLQHPWWSSGIAVWLALAVCVLAQCLRLLSGWFAGKLAG